MNVLERLMGLFRAWRVLRNHLQIFTAIQRNHDNIEQNINRQPWRARR